MADAARDGTNPSADLHLHLSSERRRGLEEAAKIVEAESETVLTLLLARRIRALIPPSSEGGSAAGAAPFDTWQPISTAPKDGTEIWVYTSEGFQRVVHWEEALPSAPDDPGHDAGWMSHDGATSPSCFYYKPLPPVDPPLRWRTLPAEPDLEDEDFDAARDGAVAAQAARSEFPSSEGGEEKTDG